MEIIKKIIERVYLGLNVKGNHNSPLKWLQGN